MSDSDGDRVPLMFRSQLEGRGKIQYAGDADPASEWVKQWLKGCRPRPRKRRRKRSPLQTRSD